MIELGSVCNRTSHSQQANQQFLSRKMLPVAGLVINVPIPASWIVTESPYNVLEYRARVLATLMRRASFAWEIVTEKLHFQSTLGTLCYDSFITDCLLYKQLCELKNIYLLVQMDLQYTPRKHSPKEWKEALRQLKRMFRAINKKCDSAIVLPSRISAIADAIFPLITIDNLQWMPRDYEGIIPFVKSFGKKN